MITGKAIVNPADRRMTMAQVIIITRNGYVSDVFSAASPTVRITDAIMTDLASELASKFNGAIDSLNESHPYSRVRKSVGVNVKIALFDIREV